MRPFGAPESTLGDLNAESAGTLLSIANDITLILDQAGVIRDLASGSEDLSRDSYADWVGKSWVETVSIESRPKVEQLLRDAAQGAAAPRWRIPLSQRFWMKSS